MSSPAFTRELIRIANRNGMTAVEVIELLALSDILALTGTSETKETALTLYEMWKSSYEEP